MFIQYKASNRKSMKGSFNHPIYGQVILAQQAKREPYRLITVTSTLICEKNNIKVKTQLNKLLSIRTPNQTKLEANFIADRMSPGYFMFCLINFL